MSSLNCVHIIGRLGADPEGRALPSGEPLSTFRLATSEKWRDKQTGERKERTEWHTVVLFGPLAEVATGFLRKGSLVFIGGSLRTRKWQDRDGNDRYTTEIVGRQVQLLGGRRESSEAPAETPTQESLPVGGGELDDDIPF